MPDSIAETVLDSVATVIDGLGLVASAQVRKRKEAAVKLDLDTLPVILVVLEGDDEIAAYTRQEAVIEYRVLVVVVAAGNQKLETDRATFPDWRQQVRRAFRKPSLSGASTVFGGRLELDPVWDRSAIPEQYQATAVRLYFMSDEAASE